MWTRFLIWVLNTNEKLFTCVFTLALKRASTKYLQLTFQKTSILILPLSVNSSKFQYFPLFWILEQYENSKNIVNLHVYTYTYTYMSICICIWCRIISIYVLISIEGGLWSLLCSSFKNIVKDRVQHVMLDWGTFWFSYGTNGFTVWDLTKEAKIFQHHQDEREIWIFWLYYSRAEQWDGEKIKKCSFTLFFLFQKRIIFRNM